jgi:hypothetical protein
MKLWQLFLAAFSLVLGDVVHAGPPFVTDDPDVPPVGAWEIDIPYILERAPGSTTMDTPLFDLNFGIPQMELNADIPIEVIHNERGGTAAGLSDIIFAVKWRFFGNENSPTELAIYPQISTPTGDYRQGLGEGRPAYALPVLAQEKWDKWSLYGNVGYWWQPGINQRNYWYAGAVIQRDITEQLNLGLELFGNTPTQRGIRPDIAFNVGGTWKLNEQLNVLFAAGRDIVGERRALLYLGLQILTK